MESTKQALHPARFRNLRHHGATGMHIPPIGQAPGVFVADPLALGGLFQVGAHVGVGLGAKYFFDAAPDDAVLIQPEPLGVAPVGENVAFPRVQIGNQGRNRVHDEAQAFLGAGELGGDPVQVQFGGFQFGGACAHPGFQLGVLAFDQLLVTALLGDVGP